MNTLVIYATKHGTTGKCASMLSEKLTGEVDLHDLKTGASPDITQYDNVIIGSSIYAGRILKEVSTFCSQNLNVLKNKKLGLFICCIIKNNAEAQLSSNFPQELLAGATAKENFGGEMRISDMGFGEKLLTNLISKMAAKSDSGLPQIDMKKDTSMLIDASIDKFAQLMNNA